MSISPNPPGIGIFPPDAQLMGPIDRDIPKTRSPKSIKRRVRIRAGLKIFRRSVFSPLFSGRAMFRYLAAAVGLFFVFGYFDEKTANESFTKVGLAFGSGFVASAIWVLLVIISIPFRLRKETSSLGKWTNDRFVYKEPKLVFTKEWNPADNGIFPLFGCPDAYPGSVIDYRIEIDGAKERLNCFVVGAYWIQPVADTLQFAKFDLRGRVVLRKDRQLGLACFSEPDTLPSIIRVYMLAWEIDPSTQLDYTELRTQTRVVLRPN